MNSPTVAVLLMMIMSWPARGQSDSSSTIPSWFMTLDGGGLFAKKAIASSPSVSMMQGIRYDRFSLGVGVGYDAFDDWQTMPLFTGISFDFVRAPGHALYVQMDAGYSRAWLRRREEGQPEYRNAGGYFYHPALGFRAGKGKLQFHMRAGYKIQNIGYDATAEWGWAWDRWYPPHHVTVTRHIERLSFQMGLSLR